MEIPGVDRTPDKFVSVKDVEEELGKLVMNNSAVFPTESRAGIIGRWIKRETTKFLDSINLEEEAVITAGLKERISDGILFAVCARCLKRAQANRRSGMPSPTFTILYQDYLRDTNKIAMDIVTEMRGFGVLKMSTFELTVTSPNGDESYARGSTQTIEWSYGDASGNRIRIELWKAKLHYKTIEKAIPNTGEYTWVIATDLEAGTTYQIKVISIKDNLIYDMSEDYFTLT